MTTDGSDINCCKDLVIEVKAVVMTRDDSSGGWLTDSGGALSKVMLHKTTIKVPPNNDPALGVVFMESNCIEIPLYTIEGHRITDDSMVLKCTLKVDLQYVAANPTFHHWQTGKKRYGLTFLSSTDARAFEHSIRRAAYEIKCGRTCTSCRPQQQRCAADGDDIFMMLRFSNDHRQMSAESADGEFSSTESSPLHHHHNQRHMCHSQPANSSTHSAIHVGNHVQRPVSCAMMNALERERRMHQLSSGVHATEENLENQYNNQIELLEDSMKVTMNDDILSLDSSYVRFAKTELDPASSIEAHEYCYPTLEPVGAHRYTACSENRLEISAGQRTCATVLPSKLFSRRRPPEAEACLSSLQYMQHQQLCIYCGDWFNPDDRQRCPAASNKFIDCINFATCQCIGNAISYHCFADAEGDFEPICSCSSTSGGCARRTVGILLSFVLPCLCCYWPLIGCHHCAQHCGCCISYHVAAEN